MRVLIIYFAEYLNSFRVGFRANVESSSRTVTNRQNLDIEINQKFPKSILPTISTFLFKAVNYKTRRKVNNYVYKSKICLG